MESLTSPLTGRFGSQFERAISSEEIILKCRNALHIDVRYLLKGTENVMIYKCIDSGYRFYHPFHIGGNDNFYEILSQKEWYYNPWRWEHEQSIHYIRDGFKVLEVGAGSGSFLKKVGQHFSKVESVGLELNSDAVAKGKRDGVNLFKQSAEDHSASKASHYDLVCSFQVLEHISDVRSMITAQLNCLKKNGTLIIAVPNNRSFIKDIILDAGVLNAPPHHMGLWDKSSLTYIASEFNLKMEKILMEPLQESSYDLYQFTLIRRLFLRIDFFAKLYWKLHCKLGLQFFFRKIISKNASKITGHTIMAVFTKI